MMSCVMKEVTVMDDSLHLVSLPHNVSPWGIHKTLVDHVSKIIVHQNVILVYVVMAH